MASTTLVTFLLQTNRTVKSVQLLGSWDNFSRPYPMEKDKRLGSGHWRGCHSFKDIICDGATVEPMDSKRDGGLLEGGRYWYYYRLDDEVEIHNRAEPSTTNCPFLPGQEVNVLEVPVQAEETHDGSFESPTATVYTLDPEDKFRAPNPPLPEFRHRTSTTQDRPVTRCGSSPPSPRLEWQEAPPAPTRKPPSPPGEDWEVPPAPTRAPPSPPTAGSERSASWEATSICSEPPVPVTGWNPYKHLGRPRTTGSLAWGDYLSMSFSVEANYRLPSPALDPNEWKTSDRTSQVAQSLAGLDLEPQHNEQSAYAQAASEGSTPAATTANTHLPSRSTSLRTPEAGSALPETGVIKCEESPAAGESISCSDSYTCSLQHACSISSARTSGMWSSLTSGSGAYDLKRSSRASQPLTPTLSSACAIEFDTTFDESPLELHSSPERHLNSGFLGYSLPEAEYSSVLTIRNLETANSCTSGHGTGAFDGNQRKQYIEAWNDGNDHRTTATQELVDDLGYLGSMIR